MIRELLPAGLVLLVLGSPLAAQTEGDGDTPGRGVSLTAQAARTELAPIVDGRPDEAMWRTAPVLGDFVQREPTEGRPASEQTEVRILYDDHALYIGAWLFDRDPASILPGETRRDAELQEGDAFVVVLDTYRDRQNGFLFATTPAGIEYDGQITREGQGGTGRPGMGRGTAQAGSGGGFNKNWDGSWDVATSRDERGWYAEFRIPFSTLRYGSSGVQTWGLNLSRNIRRNNEEAFWAPIPRQFDLYRVSMAGTLTSLEAPSQRTLTVTPYLLGSARRDYVAGNDAAWKGDVGGDAKVGLTPSLTLDLTYNTDFAQVEVDEQQVNLTRFRLFFPEKRPFFLENAGTFSVGTPQEVELFFSRRIGIEDGQPVPIVAGGRVSGKAGGLTLGLLSIQTEELQAADPRGAGDPVTLVPSNNYSVARVMRELPNRTRFGAIAVSRLNTADTEDYNVTYGLDGRLGIGRALTFDAYAAGTQTSDPIREGAEYAYSMSGAYTGSVWSFNAAFREVSEAFNPEVGFLERGDYRFVNLRAMQKIRFPGVPWFREMRPHASLNQYFDLDGFTESRWVHIDSHFEFANGAFFQLPALNLHREGLKVPFEIAKGVVIPAGSYDYVNWGFAYNTNRSAPISIEGGIDIGGFYTGRRAGANTTLNGRIGDKLLGSLRLTHYDVRLDEGDFTTSLIGLRAAYSFTPRVYLQSLIQYNDQTENFSSNIRFGWLNTAGTGLFIVYNDSQEAALFDRFFRERRALERTLVIKYTRQLNLGGF